jgi:hypothetical protein
MMPIVILTMDICGVHAREWRRKQIQRLLLWYVVRHAFSTIHILGSVLKFVLTQTFVPLLPVVDIYSKNIPLVFDSVGECNGTSSSNHGELSSVDIPSREVVGRGRDDRFVIEEVSWFL